MHILTFDFVSKTDDEAAVIAAHQPIIDAFMASGACLGVQLLRSKSRKEPYRFMFQTFWRDRDEAIAVSSRPEVMAAHDRIYEVQTREQTMGVWKPLVQAGIVAPQEAR